MKVSASSQDYLEAILELYKTKGYIRSIDISSKLGVTRASVNRAVNVLVSLGFIDHEKYSDITLTKNGIRAASAVKLKHNILKTFLTEYLGVKEQTAEEDACKMEHNISIETVEKLQKFLDENSRNNK
jgi:DtxR family Mn-dependent transcriptional regulator